MQDQDVEGTRQKCTVFDACRACTFRELQAVEVCQETGFRLILKCITTPKDNKHEIFSEVYVDKACPEAHTDLQSLKDGEIAPYKSGPTSVYWFFIIMAAFSYVTF